MKLITILSAFFFLLFTGAYAQDVPLGMQYQAVARDLQGNILSNQTITLKISLVSNTKSHDVYYSEIHEPTTNQLGLFTLVIGAGKAEKEQFSKVPWSTEDIWMQLAIKDKGKTDFATISNSKLLAVPYAFHALTASQLINKNSAQAAATTGNLPGVPSQTWSLFGNRNSDPTKDKLGTTDFVDLVLVTNNLERLRIRDNGNIEIKRSLSIGADLNVDSSVYLNKVSGATINYGPFTVERQSPTLLTGTLQVNKDALFKEHVLLDNPAYNSTSITTGALVVNGGFGLGQNLNVGGTSTLNGQVTIKPNLTGPDDTYDAYPLKVEGSTQGIAIKIPGSRNSSDNYVSFWDDNGMQGRIEGQTLDELHANEDYKDELATHIYDVTSGAIDLIFGATDVAFAAVDLVAALASTTPCVGVGVCETSPIISLSVAAGVKVGIAAAEELTVIGDVAFSSVNLDKFIKNQDAQVGVSYQSGAGDYAEYLLRADQNEKISAGDIVSVNGGKISKNTNGAGKLMVVSTSPIVLGNLPQPQFEKNYEKVAFMGQVPVKVFGRVNIGDYIIPNRVNNGVGIAVSPEKISSEDIKNIVGVAWSSSVTDLQINLINVAVGINTNDNSKKVAILEKKLNDQDTEISGLKKQIAETNTLLAKLVPGFKNASPSGVSTSAVADNTILKDAPQDYSNIKTSALSFKSYTVPREDLMKGFEIARKMMKDKGMDINKNAFWKKFDTDPGYKEQVIQMIQKKVDETVKVAKK